MKAQHDLGLGKLTRKMFRLLKLDRQFPAFSLEQEETTHITSPVIYHDSLMDLKNALLEAEHAKAIALIESRKHHFL